MKIKFTQRRIFAGLVIVLFIASLLPAKIAAPIASFPHWIVQSAIAPPATILTAAGSSFRPGPKRKLINGNTDKLRTQLGQALAYNRQLESRIKKLRSQVARLTQSSLLVNLDNIRMIDAQVATVSSDETGAILTINKGKNMGIAKGMAVVSGFNLVGKVVSCGPVTAEVELITIPGAGLSVRVVPPVSKKPKRQFKKWIKYEQQVNGFVISVSVHTEIKKGDLAHLDDERWPDISHGFIVGKVTKVTKDPKNPLNLKNVIIQPLDSLTHLHRVTVLAHK